MSLIYIDTALLSFSPHQSNCPPVYVFLKLYEGTLFVAVPAKDSLLFNASEGRERKREGAGLVTAKGRASSVIDGQYRSRATS